MILGPCFTGELKAICERVRGSNAQEADANARLIAAAPEMYEALEAEQSIHDDMRENGSMPQAEYTQRKNRAAELRRAALAKARGES
jgi:hypothetical protein